MPLVCQIYDNQSFLKSQRAGNFKPRFTDQELVTVYLFGHLNGLDLTAFKEHAIDLPNTSLFGDKAFCDAALRKQLKEQNTRLLVPLKKPKGKDQSESDKRFSRLISKFRQPIESFFKWLNDKTQMQIASSVRSANGLLLHCFGKLSFALLLLVFYS